MNNQLFPKEFIQASLEHYIFKIRRTHSVIYWIVLTSIISFLVALPFIKIDVTISGTGFIDTKSQKYDLISPVGGRLTKYNLAENRFTDSGEVLVEIDRSHLLRKIDRVNSRISEINSFLKDLLILSALQKERYLLNTDRYRIELNQYQSRIYQLELEKDALKEIFTRQKKLFEHGVISQVEFNRDKTNYEKALSEIDLFKKQSVVKWQEQSLLLKNELEVLITNKKQIEVELPKYKIFAPVRGEIQNVTSLSPGQFVQLGQRLAQITPDTTLIAICWLNPSKIGLLKEDMNVSLRVDAFNYNDWGFVSGAINNISSDAYIIDGQPLFKVECRLDKDFLRLKNGFKGSLKKGMTIQANFNVTKRTLYQLLYDELDDWLNPKVLLE